jgi:hypothetical protein
MAQLNSEAITLAAAVHSMTLTTGLRLARNFKYYRSGHEDSYLLLRGELVDICDQLNRDCYGLHNLLADSDSSHKLFLVALANQIYDRLEELHRKLICFEAADIEEMIPELDTLRTYWSDYTNINFYSDHLNQKLEKNIPLTMQKIKSGVQSLPHSVEL